MASRRTIESVSFADVQKANNGPREAPEAMRLTDVWPIDPGTRRAGLAHFSKGRLARATVLVPRSTCEIGERVRQLSWLTQRWFDTVPERRPGPQDTVLVEFPEVYSRGQGTRRPRDILWVAGSACAILGAFPAVGKVVDENPKQWKGQLSKDAANAIVVEALFPEELELLKEQNGRLWSDDNLLDAVGIGLQYLKRMRGA